MMGRTLVGQGNGVVRFLGWSQTAEGLFVVFKAIMLKVDEEGQWSQEIRFRRVLGRWEAPLELQTQLKQASRYDE
jgi:hypothetical protein